MTHKLPPVVGFCGAIGAGKDYAASIIERQLGYEPHAFADPLKMAVSVIFDLPRGALDGKNEEDRAWREQEHARLTKQFGRPMTPRLLLQEFGTECVRGYQDNIWVEAARQTVRSSLLMCQTRVVFTDVRFPNEARMIREEGGIVVRIVRGDGKFGGDAKANAHSSESGLPFNMIDSSVLNDGTENFDRWLLDIVKEHYDERPDPLEPELYTAEHLR